MTWTPVTTVTTTNDYVYTPIVTGSLFKLKHIRTSPTIKSLRIVIRQAFENEGVLAFYDYKLIAYKTELDIVLFSLPTGLSNRRLAIKRADTLLEEDWSIEIEQLQIIEGGVDLPITLSDLVSLQLQLDSIQAELTLKATDIELDNHVLSTNNPHGITLNQLGGESAGTAIATIAEHELSVNHPLATNSVRGLMSETDKARLNSMANNSTFNETNAFLLNRSNHEGSQTIDTISDLPNALNNISTSLNTNLASHIGNTNNPHSVTASQIGAELLGSSTNAISQHENTVNHPLATTSSKGMFASEDKIKLNGIQNFATNNSSDTYLLDRSKHLGEQAINTVTNLVITLATFVKLTGSQEITGVKSFNSLVYFAQQIMCNTYIAANSYYVGNTPLSVEILRTTTNQNNFCTDIGYFSIPSGGVTFRLSLVVSDANFSLAKSYIVTTCYTSDTGWLTLVPIKESLLTSQGNCVIDIRIIDGNTLLRIRRTGFNGANGTAVIRIEFTGSSSTYFQETFATTVDGNVVNTY